jgi:hypothetical protein
MHKGLGNNEQRKDHSKCKNQISVYQTITRFTGFMIVRLILLTGKGIFNKIRLIHYKALLYLVHLSIVLHDTKC